MRETSGRARGENEPRLKRVAQNATLKIAILGAQTPALAIIQMPLVRLGPLGATPFRASRWMVGLGPNLPSGHAVSYQRQRLLHRNPDLPE